MLKAGVFTDDKQSTVYPLQETSMLHAVDEFVSKLLARAADGKLAARKAVETFDVQHTSTSDEGIMKKCCNFRFDLSLIQEKMKTMPSAVSAEDIEAIQEL